MRKEVTKDGEDLVIELSMNRIFNDLPFRFIITYTDGTESGGTASTNEIQYDDGRAHYVSNLESWDDLINAILEAL